MRKELIELADTLVNALKKEGIVIQRYDSYSSNSIYLKLDYGVAYSIRISDHPGKQYLRYRYNIGTDIAEYSEYLGEVTRYFYNISDYDKLLDRILLERSKKLEEYGENTYKKFMLLDRNSNKNKKGFWAQARLV